MLKDPGFVHKTLAVLFCSDSPATASRLTQSLNEVAVLVRQGLEPEEVRAWVKDKAPDIVLLDFRDEDGDPLGNKVAAVASALQETWPNLPLVAVCRYSQPHGAVAALRAGVREIADLEDVQGLQALMRRLADTGRFEKAQPGVKNPSHSLLLMGARAGMGVSTLAVHLASLWQERLSPKARDGKTHVKSEAVAPENLPLHERAGILDLGMPVGDCLLYLNLNSDFHFVDAARNIRRLDATLLRSALAHDAHGVSVLAWPRDLQQVHDVSHADSLLLYERLKEHFGLLLTDVGGFSNPRFTAAMAQSADTVLIVADQSVGALISLAETLRELERHGVKQEQVGLVLNRYDERYGMSATQVAQRFDITLRATLPDRALQLRGSMNQGMLLHVQSRRDPYIRAVERLIDSMAAQPRQESAAGLQWWKKLGGRTGR